MLDIVQIDVHPKKYIRALHVKVYWKVVRTHVRGSGTEFLKSFQCDTIMKN